MTTAPLPGQRGSRLAALSRTGLSAEPDESFDRYAQLVRDALGVPVALVSLVDSERQFFPGLAGLGGQAGRDRSTPLSHSFCQIVVATRAALVVADARADPRTSGNPAIVELGVVAYAGVPLRDGAGVVLGSLCAIDSEPRAWTERDLAVLAGVAGSCETELRLRASVADLSAAQAQARSAQRAAEAASTRLAVLAEVSRALASTLDSDETLTRLLRLLVPRLADWAIVTDVSASGRLGPAAGRHRDPELAEVVAEVAALQPSLATDDAVVARVARTGEALLVPTVDPAYAETATIGGHLVGLTKRLGLGSLLVVPMRGRSGVMGVAALANQPGSRAFDETDLEVVGDIGRRAALALDNARLHGRQSRAAEVLQRSLLTRLPEPDHLHLVARYVPAAREAQVGGDWYDAFLTPDGATVLVIGDVVGHDIAAAAAMSQVRTMLRSTAYNRDDGPAAVLTRVDAAITGLAVDTLATVLVARVEQTAADRGSGLRRVRWSNAGHPPLAMAYPDGTVTLFEEAPDVMLGVDHTVERTEHVVELPEGATLLLYTDGLIERRDEPLGEGLVRLRHAFAGRAHQHLDEVCDSLVEVLLPAGSDDDVALIAARAYPERLPRPEDAGPARVPGDRPV